MKKYAALLFASVMLAGCSDEPPKNIQETSRDIKQVTEMAENGKKVLRIALKPSVGYDEASYFFMATEEMLAVFKKTSEYFPETQADQISFELIAPLSDKYGNSSDHGVIELSFNMAEIKKINFKDGNFTGSDLLKLSEPVHYIHPAGRKIIVGYCSDKSKAKYDVSFCRAATARIE